MSYLSSEWKGRLSHWKQTIQQDFYISLGAISLEGFRTMEHLSAEEAMNRDFQTMPDGTKWGHTYEYCWLRGKILLPKEAENKRIVMDLNTGGEATIFINDAAFGTYRVDWVTAPHQRISDNLLTSSGNAGERFDLLIEAYAGHYFPESALGGCATGPVLPGTYLDPLKEGERRTMEGCTFGIWNEDAYQLYMDVDTLGQLLEELDPDSLRADKVAEALTEYSLLVDFEQSLEQRITSYRLAREALQKVLSAKNGSTTPVFYALGNAHLDLAWLWPMAETHRKTARTFAAQLRMLDEYPDYKFLQSQPAAYEMCREHYPELFSRIKEAIKEGRWIAEGAMWVEPDTNMTSGESLIRQLIHGKRYFREEFGIDSELLWLPDTFGYSAALPQILNGCGVKYLVTQKIFWSYNEGDRFPYHYFTWQGSDGSQIDTFLPTSYTYRTDPSEISQTWKKRVQKQRLDAFLLPFGYGDGGGGPCRDHLEYLKRETDLEGLPRVRMEGPIQFFEDMGKTHVKKPEYVGELYFSAHRGVYTSQAAIKRGNRKAELALREAELWGTLSLLPMGSYPCSRMEQAWKRLLLNQFHDILPGSSIARVNEEARKDLAGVISEAHSVAAEAFELIAQGEGVTVLNAASFERTELVQLPVSFANGAVSVQGEQISVTANEQGALALVTVPSMGALSLLPKKGAVKIPAATAVRTPEGIVMENAHVSILINDRAEIVSFKDKKSGREFAAEPMNRLLFYKDVPRLFDAWDIDSNYELQEIEINDPVSLDIVEHEGLRAVVRMERNISDSKFSQEIVLEASSKRLDFITKVEWHELHRLLKVSFPIAVHTDEAVNEIQFGYVKRPTHRSRLYDKDRFEVCNQRYSALCDQNHGAAVLNDCKYGISQLDNELRLTLLRAAASPEMRADNGHHEFTYAFTAWEGTFFESPVVREAYSLNVPLRVIKGLCEPFSAFKVDVDNVFIDTVKPAEDGSGDMIIRLYEAKQADTRCTLTLSKAFSRAFICDMLENEVEETSINGNSVSLAFHTFEVKTLRFTLKDALTD